MKVTVPKTVLESALQVSTITVGSGGNDLSTHYLFRVRGGNVEILSYNQRIFSAVPMECEVEGEDGDSFTIEAWRLDKWVSGVGSGSLVLHSDGEGSVSAKGPKNKIRFRSLDPSKFPFWDGLVREAKSTGSVAPSSLCRALSLARWFVSADDTTKPELCQVEAIDGVLWATDRRALSSVEIPTLPNLNMRLPGKEVGNIMRFLSLKETTAQEIEVQSAERSPDDGGGACAILVRADGAYVGISRPMSEFPILQVDRNSADEAMFDLDVEEFTNALAVLSASAPKNHESVRVRYVDNSLVLSMPSEAGGEDEYILTTNNVENGELFEEGFVVDYPYLKGIAATFDLDTLRLGVNKRGRGGFVSFRNADEGDDGNRYYSVIVWRT